MTAAGTYTAVATSSIGGCTRTMSGTASVSINALPLAFTVTYPTGTICAGGTGFHIGLSNSTTSTTYQATLGGTPTGPIVSGTGGPIDFGLFTLGGIYSAIATNSVTGCWSTMTGTPPITLSPLPNVYSVTGGGGFCSGGTGVHLGLANSDGGISYQLYMGAGMVGGPIAGAGGPIDFGIFSTAGTYTVVASNPTTGCTQTMAGAVSITVNPLPAYYTVTGGGTFCSGGIGVDISLSGSQSGVTYQLFNGSTALDTLPGTGGAIDFGFRTLTGTYTIKGTYAGSGCNRTMTGTATINVLSSPAVYAVTGGGPICAGGSGVHIGTSGSQPLVNYQLYLGGIPSGGLFPGTGGAIDFAVFTTPGVYTVTAISTTTGCSIAMSGSAIVTVNPIPSAYTVTGGGAYCSGGTGLHVGLSSSASGIQYQLLRGMTAVGPAIPGSGSALDFGLQTVAGTYTVTATNMTTGCTAAMAGSAAISINPLPTIFSVSGGGSYCAGGSGVHVNLLGSSTGFTYQLFNGASAVGTPLVGTGLPIDFGLQTAAGIYSVVATNPTTTCTGNMAGTATVSITALVAPSVSISTTPAGTVCAGTPVSFTTAVTGGGVSPTFQWHVNGISTGTGSSYSYTPANGDIVDVLMTSSAACAWPSSVMYLVTMSVNPLPVISGPSMACVGSNTTLTAPAGCTWTSSSPSVAIISTIGTTTGVITGLSAGTTIITCTLSGCTTTLVVTVNSLPSVAASSASAGCGGSNTLTASGAVTYSWLPATGLSCATCGITIAHANVTTVYTVTGTAATGCSNTASVNIDGNRISGYISYSGSLTDVLKVWLIKYKPSDTTMMAIDSTTTCMNSGTPYYEFYDKPTGSYMVRATLIGSVPGASGYIPTYGQSSPYWVPGAHVAHTNASDTLHINMIYGTLPPGPGYISGFITQDTGAGGPHPAAGMLVLLRDAISSFIVTNTYTDAAGNYSFSNVGYGSYTVHPEDFSFYTTNSVVAVLSSGSDTAGNLNFRKYSNSRVIIPINVSSVRQISSGNGKINVFPNPASSMLHINWNNQEQGTAAVSIIDVTGRSVYVSDMNIHSSTGDAQVDVSNLRNGIYLLSIRSENIYYSCRLLIQN